MAKPLDDASGVGPAIPIGPRLHGTSACQRSDLGDQAILHPLGRAFSRGPPQARDFPRQVAATPCRSGLKVVDFRAVGAGWRPAQHTVDGGHELRCALDRWFPLGAEQLRNRGAAHLRSPGEFGRGDPCLNQFSPHPLFPLHRRNPQAPSGLARRPHDRGGTTSRGKRCLTSPVKLCLTNRA